MPVPIQYRKAPPIQMSFNWSDILLDTGYKLFYPSVTKGDSTAALLSTVADGCHLPFYDETVNGAGVERKFAVQFKRPVTVRGTAYLEFTFKASNTAGHTGHVDVTLYKWDGAAAETSIGTAASGNMTSVGDDYFRMLMTVDLTTTAFKINEYIRLGVQITTNQNSSTRLYADPGSRDTELESHTGTTINTDMVLHIPFKLVL